MKEYVPYEKYKFTKGKMNKGNKRLSKTDKKRQKVNRKGGNSRGRWFLTQKDMSEMKLDEIIAFAAANRKKRPIVGVKQADCGCGAEGCNITMPLRDHGASLPKQPKKPTKHPKRNTHPMVSGKVVSNVPPAQQIRVLIIESERGWGSKVESTRKFNTREEAEKFVKEFNQTNRDNYQKTGVVPDWYMKAEIEL